MRLRLAALLTAPFALALPAVHAQTTVKSLDQVRDVIQTDAARQMFDQQMSGKPAPDGFGTALPAGFTADFLLRQLAPGQPADRLVLAGAKPWPQRERAYVGVVCLYGLGRSGGAVGQVFAQRMRGLVRQRRRSEVRVVRRIRNRGGRRARAGRAHRNPGVRRDRLGRLQYRSAHRPGDAGRGQAHAGRAAKLEALRPARYQIRPDETAFGVRAGWSEGYSGGGADFEALYLFRIEGRALRVVFAQPMAFYKMLAGDWNPDGTREHIESDASNTLSLLPGKTDGYFDIQLRQQKGVWKQTLKWSAARQRYE